MNLNDMIEKENLIIESIITNVTMRTRLDLSNIKKAKDLNIDIIKNGYYNYDEDYEYDKNQIRFNVYQRTDIHKFLIKRNLDEKELKKFLQDLENKYKKSIIKSIKINQKDFDKLLEKIEHLWEEDYIEDEIYFKLKNNEDKEFIDFTNID